MAEKRRTGVSAVMPDTKSVKSETDEEFLSQSGVGVLLRDALLKLAEARPEDPVGFLAEHFGNLAAAEAEGDAENLGGAHEQQQLHRALWHLSLAHHSQRSAFSNNIRTAYDLLSECGSPAGLHRPGGVRGHLYTEMLQCLCSEAGLSGTSAAPLLRRIRCRNYEVVPFDVFRQGMLTCTVFADYIRKSRCLYAEVASCPERPADRALCQAVLSTLQEALETSHGTGAGAGAGARAGADAGRYLEASAKISPAKLARAMAEVRRVAGHQEGPTMDAREFEDAAAALFVARVRVVT